MAPLTDLDSAELVAPATPEKAKRGARWRGIVTLVGLVALIVAAVSSTRSAQEQVLPGPVPMGIAWVLHIVALMCAAQAWIALFPPTADRKDLARGLYTSQLTKYLPAGGVAQAASQVAFAGNQEGGVRAAALRLPVFSLCSVVGGATIGSTLVFDDDLPTWGRLLAACALLSLLGLRRSVLASILRLAKRIVKRLPEPDALPPQAAILRCYVFCLGNLLAFSIGFAVLLSDLSDVSPLTVIPAMAAAWTAGYLVVPLPGGLGVREAVIVAALPEIATGPLLAVSVAHRLLGLTAEASLAGIAHLRALHERRSAQSPDASQPSR